MYYRPELSFYHLNCEKRYGLAAYCAGMKVWLYINSQATTWKTETGARA